jgi:O-antigen/teichoic acid export membrane protein
MVKLRRSFTWSLVGNLGYNLTQFFLVIALARLGTSSMVGQFALAQAISAPIFLMVGLNLRAVRATDVKRVWSADQYGKLRFVLNVLSLLVTVGVGLIIGLRGTSLAVLVIIAMAKSAEATSQLMYGYFQIRQRLDLVSRSFLLRAGLGAAGFVSALVATGGLPEACLGMLAGWVLVYLVHDAPLERRLLRDDAAIAGRVNQSATVAQLARKAFPLGLDAGVTSLANNVPRYSIQAQLGTAALGTYAALAYLGQVATMLTGAMADALIGRLAIEADRRDVRAFKRSMTTLLVFGMGVSGVIILGAWAFGAQLIGLLLGDAYVDQPLLIWLVVAAAMTTLQRCLGRGLQATHRYTAVLAVDTVTLVVTLLTVPLLVSAWGTSGAGAGVALAFLVGAFPAGWILIREVARMGQDLPATTSRIGG